MDVRAFICGVLSLACIAAAAVTGEYGSFLGLAGTTAGYVVGLFSDPYSVVEGDE